MITQLEAVALCQQIYAPISPGVFDVVLTNKSVTAGVRKFPNGTTAIAFAGSENARDWFDDFDTEQLSHPQLGILHKGMWQGMDDIFAQLKPHLTGNLSVTGHSLGCSHAQMLAGLCAVNGIPVDQLALFAPPRCSYEVLKDILIHWVPEIKSYRNGPDPVPKVPASMPLEDWVELITMTMLDVPPDGWHRIDIFEWHMIPHYVTGVERIS